MCALIILIYAFFTLLSLPVKLFGPQGPVVHVQKVGCPVPHPLYHCRVGNVMHFQSFLCKIPNILEWLISFC